MHISSEGTMSKPSLSLLISIALIILLVTPGLSQTRVGKFGVGVEGSMQYLLGGGSTNPVPGFGGGVNLSCSVMESFSVRTRFAVNQLGWKGGLNKEIYTDMMTLNLYLCGDLMPNSEFNIFPFIGGGAVFYDPKFDDGGRAPEPSWDIQYRAGLGLDYFLSEFWSISGTCEYVFTGTPYYAGSAAGIGSSSINPDKDSFLRISLQVRYYFFDQSFITELLKAQRDRSKRNR
jgi:hypothetical protein